MCNNAHSQRRNTMKKTTCALILSFYLSSIAPVKALDTIILIPALAEKNYGAVMYYTRSVLSETEDRMKKGDLLDIVLTSVIGLIYLGVAVLNEDGQSASINTAELSEMGYSKSEIDQFANDMNAINKISQLPKDQQENEFRGITLSAVTLEILNLQ